MSNVISFKERKEAQNVENEFIKLLDKETKKEGNVSPLSSSLFQRMAAIKKASDEAQARTELLEG
ncbi:hypothetical protein A6E12_06555 [Aliivibrio fischeri]|uniref:hypothetical protein n=1 Tax=Aliivibrio fischeri TaxID=668 RepID=UPI00080DE69B|nr:hypothetical protein [Aliivibrio fischeri]OCH29046.1 hypothetical protein A6E12_06555 [Aliivibrio fischeri]